MAYLSYMPQSFAAACRAQTDVCPEDIHTEYRLRAGGCSAVTYNTPSGENASLVLQDVTLTEDDLRRVLLRFCRGSLYAYDAPMRRGYLTPAGFPGLRIGVAGRALCDGSSVIGLQSVSSLCVRLPHPYLMETDDMLDMILRGDAVTETDTPSADKHRPTKKRVCSTLFYAPPGIGKTTLLRAVISHLADAAQLCPLCVAVIDTGEELYIPSDASLTADVFSAYPRGVGMAIAARAFSPDVLICDEIGDDTDARELLHAQGMGVPVIATAHADTLRTLLSRPAFAELHKHRVFAQYVGLGRVGTQFLYTVFDAESRS